MFTDLFMFNINYILTLDAKKHNFIEYNELNKDKGNIHIIFMFLSYYISHIFRIRFLLSCPSVLSIRSGSL